MTDREQFEAWCKSHPHEYVGNIGEWWTWQACAESKQAELDKANARIAQLEEALIDARVALLAVTSNFQGVMAVRADNPIGRIHIALAKKPNTWLSQHDKAVEVKVLEDVINHCAFFNDRDEVIATIVAMLESRK